MAGTIEVLVPGGQADPGPPLGPELGPTPVDVQGVVQQINDQTAAFDGTEVPVTIEGNNPREFKRRLDDGEYDDTFATEAEA